MSPKKRIQGTGTAVWRNGSRSAFEEFFCASIANVDDGENMGHSEPCEGLFAHRAKGRAGQVFATHIVHDRHPAWPETTWMRARVTVYLALILR